MKAILWVLLANYGVAGLSLITALYTRNVFGPSFAGALASVGIITLYLDQVYGVFRASLDRELPLAKGSGDDFLAQDIDNHIYWLIFFSTLIGSGIYLIGYLINSDDQEMAFAYLACMMLHGVASWSTYLKIYYKINGKFRTMSIVQLTANLYMQCPALLGAKFAGLFGYIFGLGFGVVANIYNLKSSIRSVRLFQFNISTFKTIILSGVPLAVYGLSLTAFSTIDRLVLAAYFTLEDVGYYAFAMLLNSTLFLFPTALSTTILTPYWFKYAAKQNWVKVNSSIMSTTVIVSCISTLVILFMQEFFPLFVSNYMNSFLPSVEVAKILLFSVYWLFLFQPFSVILSAKCAYFSLIVCSIISLVVFAVLIKVLLYMGILGVAVANLISYIVFANGVIALSQIKLKIKPIIILEKIFILNLPGGIAITCYLFIESMAVIIGIYISLLILLYPIRRYREYALEYWEDIHKRKEA